MIKDIQKSKYLLQAVLHYELELIQKSKYLLQAVLHYELELIP